MKGEDIEFAVDRWSRGEVEEEVERRERQDPQPDLGLPVVRPGLQLSLAVQRRHCRMVRGYGPVRALGMPSLGER